jgi:hypothetical protein
LIVYGIGERQMLCADAQAAIAPRNPNGAAQDGDQHGPDLSEQSMPLANAPSRFNRCLREPSGLPLKRLNRSIRAQPD